MHIFRPRKRKFSPGRKIQVGGEGMHSVEFCLHCPSIFKNLKRSYKTWQPGSVRWIAQNLAEAAMCRGGNACFQMALWEKAASASISALKQTSALISVIFPVAGKPRKRRRFSRFFHKHTQIRMFPCPRNMQLCDLGSATLQSDLSKLIYCDPALSRTLLSLCLWPIPIWLSSNLMADL